MDQNPSPRLHPLLAIAAVSVILLSGVGIAAITGVLPHFGQQDTPAASTAATLPATPPPAQDKTPETSPAVAETPHEPVHKRVRHVAETEAAPSRRYDEPAPRAATCLNCGTVISVTPVVVQPKASGVGAVGGAILGGVLGHQFGGGHGKDAMTAVGAIGGALAGNEVEKSQRQTTRYDVGVRLEDGSVRSFSFSIPPDVSVGDRVKVENGTLLHN